MCSCPFICSFTLYLPYCNDFLSVLIADSGKAKVMACEPSQARPVEAALVPHRFSSLFYSCKGRKEISSMTDKKLHSSLSCLTYTKYIHTSQKGKNCLERSLPLCLHQSFSFFNSSLPCAASTTLLCHQKACSADLRSDGPR